MRKTINKIFLFLTIFVVIFIFTFILSFNVDADSTSSSNYDINSVELYSETNTYDYLLDNNPSIASTDTTETYTFDNESRYKMSGSKNSEIVDDGENGSVGSNGIDGVSGITASNSIENSSSHKNTSYVFSRNFISTLN